MTIRPMFDMMEATRLTREGRLTEAMALLRGAPPAADGPTTAPSSDRDADPREGNARASVLLDTLAGESVGCVEPARESLGGVQMPFSISVFS
jgi:hypothetical protein